MNEPRHMNYLNDSKLLIDGNLVDGDMMAEVINPATGKAFALAPVASRDQLNDAVRAARGALPGWSQTPLESRRKLILEMADLMEANADPLAAILTAEQGKPLHEAMREVTVAASTFRAIAALDPTVKRDSANGRRVETRTRPLGVVAAIVPWNFPLILMAMKLPAALLAGNTVVLKPAPTTPLSTLMLGRLIRTALPHGVVNVLNGAPELGAWITEHPGIDKISFTGSTETGMQVMAGAATSLKRITLELGGNDAAIVLDDAVPAAIASAIFASAFQNNGQTCVAIKRLYVHGALYDEVCRRLCALADEACVADGMTPGVRLGPLQNERQFSRILDLIEEGKRHGRIVAGGRALDQGGYFVRPTIVRDIGEGNRLVDEEQFGPVLPILRFTAIDDAIARANRSRYGLGASVWSGNIERALAIAQRLEAGTVWINKHGDIAPGIPFGGAKMSGIGSELGPQALNEFSQLQVINATA